MDKKQARDYFQCVRDLVQYTAGLESENKTDFRLPEILPHRLRKLARLGVLCVERIFSLETMNRIHSKGPDVLPPLKLRFSTLARFS